MRLLGVLTVAAAAAAAFAAVSVYAQQPDVTFTAEGPSTAHPGETVSYKLHYLIEGGPGTDVRLAWTPGKAAYISTTVISGQGPVCYEQAIGATVEYVRCSLAAGSGTLEIAFQIPLDVTSGSITFGGSEPGTGTGPGRPLARSNIVVTVITPPPAAPPDTGVGSLASGGQGIPGWVLALLVAAGISAIAVAARTGAPRRRT